MAHTDISRTFSELDTEDLSLETTVPTTDLSLSDDLGNGHDGHGDRTRKKLSKQLLERKQLLHDIQVLKIELSQKKLLLDNVKADSMQKIEELEEKLSDAVHGKQILQARLEAELKIQQDESCRRHEKIQHELEGILRRQHQLEATNERLQERAIDIRKSLDNLDLTEGQYQSIKSRNEEELSIKDFVSLKIYEFVKPWKTENGELKSRCRTLADDLYKTKSDLEKTSDDLLQEKKKNEDLNAKYQKLSLLYTDVKSQVQTGDYKIENYDKVKRERDEFDHELTELKKAHAYLQATHESTVRERDDLLSEMNANKQTIELLSKDKAYFSRQVSDTHNKLLYAEDRVMALTEQLDRAKQGREELYDKYVASRQQARRLVVQRDQYKAEYEAKLRDELENIRLKTNTEIDRLKTDSREMYERENRNLREARDLALSEKDRAASAEKDALGKYEQLMQDFRQHQISTDNKIAELHNEVKIKAFEAERTQMVYEETVRNFKESQLDNEKLNKKLEVLTKEYYSLQATLDRRSTELEGALAEKNTRLETYEKLENELDDVVMQAADVEDEEEAERVLFSYGYGANVPTTAKRRLKQSVHLARRVLQLERANTSMRKEVEREQTKNKQLAQEVKSANKLLDQSQQPYHYLVESVRVRDGQISKQLEHISALEEDVKRLETERATLVKAKNSMATDLERLLNHKEEMSVMKQVVLNLSQRRHEQPEKGPRVTSAGAKHTKSALTPRKATSKATAKKTSSGSQVVFGEPDADMEENVHKPGHTEFTSQHPPDWYKRLQSKAKMNKSKYSGQVS